MTETMHGIAIVGYGGMGSQHARNLSNINRIKLVGTYDIKEKRQEAARANGYHTFSSFDEVLREDDVNIVLIATPNDSHKDLAIEALKAGKNVICEKPVTLNSVELEEVLETANKYDRVFTVFQNRRWDEDFLSIKKLFDEKTLGDVFNIEQRIHGSRGIPGDWRHKKEHGGGMMLDWGVHLIDRLTIMIKEPIKIIYCTLSYVLGNEVDDGFKLHITFESGMTASIDVGTTNFISLPIWYMTGTSGTAMIHDWEMNGQVVLFDGGDKADATPIKAGAGLTKTMAPRKENGVQEFSVPRVETDIRDYYLNVIDAIDAIDGKAELIVKAEEVMRVMKIMEAAFKSAETNQVIYFE